MNKAMVVLTGLILLAGCSGGGDGGDSPPPAAQAPADPNLTVPLQTALANIVNHGFNQAFTISGSVDNSTPANPAPPTPVTGNGQLTLAAATPTTLCNFSVSQAAEVVTGTTVANGTSSPFASTGTVYYRSDNTTVATNAAGKTFLFLPVAFPSTVRAGDAGPTGAGTEVDSHCDKPAFAEASTGAYSVAGDTANSLLVTFVNTVTQFGGGGSQSTTVYRIDTSGNVSLVSVTATQSFLGSVFKTLIFIF